MTQFGAMIVAYSPLGSKRFDKNWISNTILLKHVVLHDLDAVLEQVCYCGLAAGHKNAVRGDFLEQMALSSVARAKLTQVKVVLDQWQHTSQQ